MNRRPRIATGQWSDGSPSPRLDKGTQLVNRALAESDAYRVKVWEEAGEAVIWLSRGESGDLSQVERDPLPADEGANRERASRRARKQARLFAATNHCDWLVTLTYAPPQPTDPDVVLRHVQAFQRRLEAARPDVAWLRVFELHKSGALHVHFLMNGDHHGERRHRRMRGLWGQGFVDVRRFGNGGRGAYRRAARYAAKYASKGAVAGFGRHSYEVRQGFQPAPVELAGWSMDEAWSLAVATMGGEVPEYTWQSSEVVDWRGPPTASVSWP